MLKPTQAHKERLEQNKKEPTIRMGRKVPKDAVNLGYYYNPTASGEERVLTSDAPRNIIDHRIEEDYRYLFNQSSNDDNLFPGFLDYEDEAGYQGRLGRMYVNWYSKSNVQNKNVKEQKKFLGLLDKSDVPKMITYDKDGFSGSLYYDSANYEVAEYKEVQTQIPLDYTVQNHELSFYNIFNPSGGTKYINASELKSWLIEPGKSGSKFPTTIEVTTDKLKANGGLSSIQDFVNAMKNPYIDSNGPAVGTLTFKNIEFEPIDWQGSTPFQIILDEKFMASVYNEVTSEDDDVISDIDEMFPQAFQTYYDWEDDTYDTKEIEVFKDLAADYSNGSNNSSLLNKYLRDGRYQVTIFRTYHKVEEEEYEVKISEEETETYTRYKFWAKYSATVTLRGDDAQPKYNVVCNYSGVLKTQSIFKTYVPYRYNVTANYTGIVRKVWYTYDGVAYYRGSVTKGSAIGNVNPLGSNEILMFPDDNGFLRTRKGFYEVEADLVYLTDVFKDGVPCFYKYTLKKDLYDSIGPDVNGNYTGTAIDILTGTLKQVPRNYKYTLKMQVSETETEDYITDDFQVAQREIPMRYHGYLYTSFISGATDTFKCVYNGFNDSDKDNIALENGVIEDIYNAPFFQKGTDFTLVPIDIKARTNKIKLSNPGIIEDTRRYISFSYRIVAEDKMTGRKFESDERTTSILNKEYALSSELKNFNGRAMNFSPQKDGMKMTAMDIVLTDQASRKDTSPILTSKSTEFLFYVKITNINNNLRGAVNVTCNTDGSGYLYAETSEDTGFFDEKIGTYTKKLAIGNEYILEDGKIYLGYQVKCIDARKIKVNQPRETDLLESWYPMIQFGHYSQIIEQYGVGIKVAYTMPEYDTQNFSKVYGNPFVDITKDKVTFVNSTAIKINRYPILPETVRIFKRIDEELFEIKVKDVSFSDGVIITSMAVSENDDLIADYTYLEENYVYRGFWREQDDFCRIDLNPNIYHTYSDMTYTPAEDKPSKNLFNKVIHYFMRPSVVYDVVDKKDLITEEVDAPEPLYDLYKYGDRFSFLATNYGNYHAKESDENSWIYDSTVNSFKQPEATESLNGFLSQKDYINYEITVKIMSGGPESGLNGIMAAYGLNQYLEAHHLDVIASKTENKVEVYYNLDGKNEALLFQHKDIPGYNPNGWNNDFIVLKVKKTDDKIEMWHSDWNSKEIKEDTKVLVDLAAYSWGSSLSGKIHYGYENKGQSKSYFEPLSFIGEIVTERQYQIANVKYENKTTLYHKIDDSVPNDSLDIYIGSAYIRQNTSLKSTILIDTRSYGGGVIESMKDELRRQLEPESDWYLDIGFYDGKPYQENGVILIRLEESLLKENGGRFTMGDIESRVKRWLGFGVLPIIEYVPAFTKQVLPQYSLEIIDSYSNVTEEILEIYPEVED